MEEKRKYERQRHYIIEKGPSEQTVRAILNKYKTDPRSKKTIREFVEYCRKLFNAGKFKEDKLRLLGESIIYLQGDEKDVELYARICIANRDYTAAHRFITGNLTNINLTKAGKASLIKLQKELSVTIKRTQLVEMILEGKLDDSAISAELKIPKEEVTAMREKFKRSIKPFPTTEDKKGENR